MSSKTKSKSQDAAATTLGKLPTEMDKESLSNATPESGIEPIVEYEPDDGDEFENAEAIDTFTEKDEADLPVLEKTFGGGQRGSIAAGREIRRRQLWRLSKDADGNPRNYKTFGEYAEAELGHTKEWLTQQTNWLAVEEAKDRVGITTPLSVHAAQALCSYRLPDAGGLKAVLEEARENGGMSAVNLKTIIDRRADFFSADEDDDRRPAAKSYAEYKADLVTLNKLGSTTRRMTDFGIVEEARKLSGMFSDNLVALCKTENKLPAKQLLLAAFTGDVLDDVVCRLQEIVVEADDIETKKNLLKAKKKQLKEGQAGIRAEAKALEKELVAKGAIKQNGKVPHGKLSPDPDEAGHETDQEDEVEEENHDGEVLHAMKMAEEFFDEAMESDEWPTEEVELNVVLEKARDCEIKLAEITARVKELFVDVPQPEALPSGDN
jgi:hypothetical protein